MGLEQVIQEVRRDGEARAQKILDDAKAEAAELLQAAKDKVSAYEADRTAQADRDAEQTQAQVRSHAGFEARKILLQTEAELRERLKRTLQKGFADLPAATRQKHLKKLLKRAAEELGSGTVFGAKKDEAFLKKDATFSFGGTVDIAGGIIVESKDGKNRLDLSYETLLDEMWRDILKAEAALFA